MSTPTPSPSGSAGGAPGMQMPTSETDVKKIGVSMAVDTALTSVGVPPGLGIGNMVADEVVKDDSKEEAGASANLSVASGPSSSSESLSADTFISMVKTITSGSKDSESASNSLSSGLEKQAASKPKLSPQSEPKPDIAAKASSSNKMSPKPR